MDIKAARALDLLVKIYGSEAEAQKRLGVSRPTWARWKKELRIPPGMPSRFVEELIKNGS